MQRAAETSESLGAARRRLAGAARLFVLTGAGVSAPSGVPTFRGAAGLWRDVRPEELATPQAFARDPEMVWEWYRWRRTLVAACAPNAAHHALARHAAAHHGVTLATQNVDGLHETAAESLATQPGPAESVRRAWPLTLHGSLFVTRCTHCDYQRDDRHTVQAGSGAAPPRCPACGALLRPGVVWFGESLPAATLEQAAAAARAADVCLVIGTSGVVHPAAGLAELTTEAGGTVIEVNPEKSALTALATISLRGSADVLVPALLERRP